VRADILCQKGECRGRQRERGEIGVGEIMKGDDDAELVVERSRLRSQNP